MHQSSSEAMIRDPYHYDRDYAQVIAEDCVTFAPML